jgi:serine/threonine-protein kinase RsbW
MIRLVSIRSWLHCRRRREYAPPGRTWLRPDHDKVACWHEIQVRGNPAAVDPPATPTAGRGRAEPPDKIPHLWLVVYAEPAAALIVRRSVRKWLQTLAWPTEGSDDVVTAVNEACTNAIEHAYPPDYPGYVTIDGSLTHVRNEREVTFVVRDRGHWRPTPLAPGFRGYGFTVMRGCMRTVSIEPSPEGTTLVMISFPAS